MLRQQAGLEVGPEELFCSVGGGECVVKPALGEGHGGSNARSKTRTQGRGRDWIASGHVTASGPWAEARVPVGVADEPHSSPACHRGSGALVLAYPFTLFTTGSLSPRRPTALAHTRSFPRLPPPMALPDLPSKPLPPPAKDEKLPSLPPLDFDRDYDELSKPHPPPKIVHDFAPEHPPPPHSKPVPIDVHASLAASDLCMYLLSSDCLVHPDIHHDS